MSGTITVPVPPGRYYLVANCYDPDGDMVNVTITTQWGTETKSGTEARVGALIVVTDDMGTLPASVTWDDGEDSFTANIIISLGVVPPTAGGGGGSTPGFGSVLTMISLLGACLVLARQRTKP